MTSSWPWMRGFAESIADPIPPVTEHDTRPSIKDLIVQHRDKVTKVRSTLASNVGYDASKHDDLWILRFLLSHKFKTKKAIKAAEHTLSFRKEYKLDEKDLRPFPPGKDAPDEAMQRYMKHLECDAIRSFIPDPRRGVIVFLVMTGIDQHALIEHVDESDWLPAFMYMSEWTFQWLDYISRTTGRLTKSIRLADARGMSFGNFNHENNLRDSRAMAVMEDVYPQLLQTIFPCHCPAWVQIPWRILRPIIPKRVIEKIDFMNPDKNDQEKLRVLQHISIEHLPARFGGEYETWPAEFALPKVEQ